MAISRLAWVVLVLVLVGAIASLFGPDFFPGRVVATAYSVSFWLGAWLYARHPDSIFPEAWSIAERRAWTALVFVGLIFIAYLRFMVTLAAMEEAPSSLGDLPADHFGVNLAVLFIAWGVISAALKGKAPDVIEADERDLRARAAADRVGDWGLTLLVCWCAGLLAFQPAERLAWWLAPLIAANVLIGILIVKTLVEHAYLVSRYAWDRR